MGYVHCISCANGNRTRQMLHLVLTWNNSSLTLTESDGILHQMILMKSLPVRDDECVITYISYILQPRGILSIIFFTNVKSHWNISVNDLFHILIPHSLSSFTLSLSWLYLFSFLQYFFPIPFTSLSALLIHPRNCIPLKNIQNCVVLIYKSL
jgi:hypothetical protein